jgi:hypothetical protein
MAGLTEAGEGYEGVVIIPLVVELPDGLYELQVHVNFKEVPAEDRMELVRTHCKNLLEMVRMEEEERQQQQTQDQDLPGSGDGNLDPPQEPPSDWNDNEEDQVPNRTYPPQEPLSDWSDNEEDRAPNIQDRTWYDWDSEDHPREE